MRNFSVHKQKRFTQNAFKCLLFVLLFSFIFASVILSVGNFNVADATAGVQAASRNPTAQSVSTTSATGENVVSAFNSNHNDTYAKYFGISTEVSDGVSKFGWNSAENGWGYTDWSSSDNASIWWIEITFTGLLKTAVSEGRVSIYASSSCNFSDGTNDECTMGINYVTTHAAPHVNWIGTGRSGSSASWNTSNAKLQYSENWSDSYERTISFGAAGGFNSSHAIPTTATGVRMIFAAIADGAMDGGFTSLNLTLYTRPNDTISSSNSTFSLTNGLYGDEYKINPNVAANFGSLTKVSSGSNSNSVSTVGFNASTNIQQTSQGITRNFGTLTYSTAGIFAGLHDGSGADIEYYAEMSITVPKGVTHISMTGNLRAYSYVGTSETTDTATATAQIYNSAGTAVSSAKSTATCASATGGSNHSQNTNISWSNIEVNSTPATTSKTFKIRLTLKASHPNYTGNLVGWGSGDDDGHAYALLGNLKIKMFGAYYVAYNGNTGSGSMSTQTFYYGRKDSTETLTANAFTKTNYTFVGWALEAGGAVAYSNRWNTSNSSTATTGSLYTDWTHEITKTPGATVTLYATWKDSDFGKLSSGTSGVWGSENNPYVISKKEHWINLVDIVNRNRDPVDSVQGTFYGNTISSSNAQAAYRSFQGCYFVVTTSINVGSVDPVGNNTTDTAADAQNFKGTIYGGAGVYSGTKTLRTITVDISSTETNTGLFKYLNGATIEYLGVAGKIMTTSTQTGGIVGSTNGTVHISNCKSTVNIIAATFDAANNPTPKDRVGGIVGYVNLGSTLYVDNCEYAGSTAYTFNNVDGTQVINANLYGATGVGGIVGLHWGGSATMEITNCKASGRIVGTQAVGGVLGHMDTGSVTLTMDNNSSSATVIASTQNAGGIIGYLNGTTIKANVRGNKNTGDVTAPMNVGGIAGNVKSTSTAVDSVKFENLYNSGNITATGETSTVGGIVGYFYYNGTTNAPNTVVMRYAYNCGTVTASGTNVGGVVGCASGSRLEYCYNTGTVNWNSSANTNIGSIIGQYVNGGKAENSWAFFAQNAATANFTASNVPANTGASGQGSQLVIAISTSTGAATYTRPSDASNKAYNWTDITNTDIQFTKFMLFYTPITINNGKYLVIRNSSNTRLTPDSSKNRQSSTIAEKPNTTIEEMVFSASMSATKVAVEQTDIWATTSLTKSMTYDGRVSSSSIAKTSWSYANTTYNKYASSVDVEYYNGTWADCTTVKDVYFASGAVQAYKVKILLKNGDHLVGVYCPDGATFTINQKQLTVTTDWNNAKNTVYTYNTVAQGLKSVTITGFVSSETIETEFTITPTGLGYAVASSVINLDDTINVGTYGFELAKKTNNYSLKVDGTAIAVATTSQSWTWTINEKSIATSQTNVRFGYGAGGVVAGSFMFDGLYALDERLENTFYGADNSPWALVYKDGDSTYTNFNNYNIFYSYKSGENAHKLDYGTEYTATVNTGGSLGGSTLTFNSGSAVKVEITLTGTGNYTGKRIIRFTLMDSDFGGRMTEANWGSLGNPYLIEDEAHLVRLSQITNGAQAWNSLKLSADDEDIAAYNNPLAFATERTYSGAYFRLCDNVQATTAGGFKPIGMTPSTLYMFRGAFDGDGYTVTLNIDESGKDYVGLFGYVVGKSASEVASLSNIKVTGAAKGRDYVGSIAGFVGQCVSLSNLENTSSVAGRDWVGGIIGKLQGSDTLDAMFMNGGEVSGRSYVGGVIGEANNSKISGATNNAKVSRNSSYSGTSNYIGGIVGKTNSNISNCSNKENGVIDASTSNYVGGVVGKIDGGVVISYSKNVGAVTGGNYVGGIAGHIDGVTVADDVIASANVTGKEHVGGVAGRWEITDIEQAAVANTDKSAVTSSVTIQGVKYVGGIAGWMNATGCENFIFSPYLSNNEGNPINVIGESYVGGILGGFEGHGYKKNSSSLQDEDSIIYIRNLNSANNKYINVSVTLNGGNVAGGLIGYASNVGVIFMDNWVVAQHTPITITSGSETSFFGGVIGVVGENAAVESGAQPSEGGYNIGGTTVYISYAEAYGQISVGGDFVGSIFGYIASTAGKYVSSDTTLFGNSIQLINATTIEGTNSSQGIGVSGRSYVGGLIGAIGKVTDYSSSDASLNNLLKNGKYASGSANNTVRLAPSDDNGNGKLINRAWVRATVSYAGGIVGYAGEGSLLAFVNKSAESGTTHRDATTYLNVFNSYTNDLSSLSTTYIWAGSYAGGIAGYVSSSMNIFTNVVNTMYIVAGSSLTSATGDYAGGLFGYMGGGRIEGGLSVYRSSDTTADGVRGGSYIGGLVGMLAGGSITNSVNYGFKFTKVSDINGGVVGSTSAGTSITSSWAVYVASSPTYSTVSANRNGKYVIIDSSVVTSGLPNFFEYGKMTGLYASNISITPSATNDSINKGKNGSLSLKTRVPTNNKQIVYYDVSGNDKSTGNVFEVFEYPGDGDLYYRFDMATSSSFSICVKDIEFKNLPVSTASNKVENAKKSYSVPASGDKSYTVEMSPSNVELDSNGYIYKLTAQAMYENGGRTRQVGNFNKTFTIGDSSTPYIITQSNWNSFIANIKGSEQYSGKFVKLGENITISSASYLAGDVGNASKGFKGNFDGDGYSITVTASSSSAGVSVFPNASGATFRNLTIKGTITTSAANAAGFVAVPQGNLEFYNCTNEANVTAKRSTGGIVGYTNNKTIKLVTCVNKGNVESSDPIESAADTVEGKDPRDTNRIEDFTNYKYGTGGIIGYANSAITIESCKNEKKVTGAYNVGGIIGNSNSATQIYNCANTGQVLGDGGWASEDVYALKSEGGTYTFIYVGGICGKVDQNGSLTMLACYNTGKIVGYGPIVGGLVGGVGFLDMAKGGFSADQDKGVASYKSLIAYCYNSGEVYSGGTRRTGVDKEHLSLWYQGGREELCGSLVGGIAGFVVSADINFCYNTGKISTYRIVGYLGTWQSRIGGIVGQAQPSESTHQVYFRNCYNVGLLYVDCRQYGAALGLARNVAYWGGGICGYLDKKPDAARLRSSNCYTIANYMHFIERDNPYNRWGSASLQDVGDADDQARYVVGTVITDVTQLTAYMNASGSLVADTYIGSATYQASSLIDRYGNYNASYSSSSGSVTYSSAFLNGTAYGYLYIYGCLPQLAVFALDTKEGLSMNSVSYGKNDYGEYVGSIAGSKESPYVIKDGVDLLAMSALVGATSNSGSGSGTGYFSFKDKYIAFADGSNNIAGTKASYINMDMSTASDSLKSGTSTSYTQTGKNYFLWNGGGAINTGAGIVCSGADSAAEDNVKDLKTVSYYRYSYGRSPKAESTIRNAWVGKNNYFNGSSYTKDANFTSYANFYSIGSGGNNVFEGSISGLQGTSGNTQIRNLKISQKGKQNEDTFVGLFGNVNNASISNISVTGVINGYAYENLSNNTYQEKVFAGGIAGYAGGNTSISNCYAGVNTSATIDITAYGEKNTVTSVYYNDTFAGGIVGAVGSNRNRSDTASKRTIAEISGCTTQYANVKTSKRYAGGIVGYVGDPWTASTVSGSSVSIQKVNTLYLTTITAVSGITTSGAGSEIGGIVGANDGIMRLTIDTVTVSNSSTSGVTITGEHSLGGVIGVAKGNVEISGATVGYGAKILRASNWSTVDNATEGGTAMGGIIGYSLTGTNNFLSGNIIFRGAIDASVGTVKNLGGVIGSMGTGTYFQSGSNVTVAGEITASVTGLTNIGGVAGYTYDGAFDGKFTISIKLGELPNSDDPGLDNARNVGGFIGYNSGTTHFLASTAGTEVKISSYILARSEVGGLVGYNAGSLQIGADMYQSTPYTGDVTIEILSAAKVNADSNSSGKSNLGGIVGQNSGNIVITKGVITNSGTITGQKDNVGGIIGNNVGEIAMGGSTVENAALTVTNAGAVSGGDNVGGVIGYLTRGNIAGTFANTGSVEGANYVGGSIGRMDAEAKLFANGENTYFYNGEEDKSSAMTSSDALAAADTSAPGTVTGSGNYVGGSIGAMFGVIEGSAGAEVCFINTGTVSGVNYVGGNIGVLAGSVSAAQFSNSGKVESSTGSIAIGGSVGIVGIPKALKDLNISHKQVKVNVAHFEFTGDQGISVTGNGVDPKETEGGVGGAIGIIGGSKDEDFDNIGSLWQNVTMYAASNVSAPNVKNVGGAVGLIKANYITISNMLAFYTEIVGYENVGGIVGGIVVEQNEAGYDVTGIGIEVTDSFNIEGSVSATKTVNKENGEIKHAGGIIGLAADDTDADTSYWVKGYANEVLMTLNIDDITDSLGKYKVVEIDGVIFTKDLTDQYDDPFDYTGDDAYKNKSWEQYFASKGINGDISLQNDVWAYEVSGWTQYTTGTSQTGWYYVFANNRDGIDVSHIVATDKEKYGETYESVLSKPESRKAELVYWKRIANAYTDKEREPGKNGTPSEAEKDLDSQIVAAVDLANKTAINDGTGTPRQKRIYAAALASTESGYYLYMDASGTKPDVYHSTQAGDDNFYIAADTETADNVVVYYRSLSIGRPLTYNGYNRYAAITDTVSENETIHYAASKAEITQDNGNYFYTMTDKNGNVLTDIYKAGEYKVNINIYYYDSFSNLATIGGITDGEFIINEQPLKFSWTKSNSVYNGSQTTGYATLTVEGVAPLDNNASRSVQIKLNGEIWTAVNSNNKQTIGNSNVSLGALMDGSRKTTDISLGTTKIYLAEFSYNDDIEMSDMDNIVDSRHNEMNPAKGYTVTLKFKFNAAIAGELTADLLTTKTATSASPNYKATPKNGDDEDFTVEFNITPRKIEIKYADGAAFNGYFNGSTYGTRFIFDGWWKDDDTTKYVNEFNPYVLFIPATGATVGSSSDLWDISSVKTFSLSDGSKTYSTLTWMPNNNRIDVSGMKYEGEYQIGFATTNLYKNNGKNYPATVDGNYYLDYTNVPDEFTYFIIGPNEFTLSWSKNDSGVYNAQKHDFVATFTATEPFESVALLVEEMATMFPSGYGSGKGEYTYTINGVDAKTVTVTFGIGPNAGKYDVNLPKRRSEDNAPSTENCKIKEVTTGKFTIDKLEISVELSGNVTEQYDGGYHTAEKITATSADAKANPSEVYNSTNGTYTLTMYSGETIANTQNDNKVTIQLSYGDDGVAAVNVGNYTATIGSVSPVGADNFNVTTSGSGAVVIEPAVITLTWSSTDSFKYNGAARGRGLSAALTSSGAGMTFVSTSYTPAVSNAALTAKVTNAFSTQETIRVPIGGTPAAINVDSYNAVANMSGITVSGLNALGTNSIKGNYKFEWATGQDATGSYSITPLILTGASITGNKTSKVYDATTAVPDENIGSVSFSGLGSVKAPTSYSVTAVYENSQVGSRKINYTVTLSGQDATNFKFNPNLTTYRFSVNGTITARPLVVTLDILRNNTATRVYNSETSYGGDGASNISGSVTATSEIHRSGEGFRVSGFASKESTRGVIITAAYAEASSGRTAFDGYVNNVVGSGANLSVGDALYGSSEYFYKNLVFTMSGSSATNYSFTVKVGDTNVGDKENGSAGSTGVVTVKDASNGGFGGLIIEITANVFKATYSNTAQSYANADNTYNTEWIPVTGTVSAVGSDQLSLYVTNNWMYEGNNDRNPNKVYKSYTVIRGAAGSNVLAARVDSTDGVHVNYKLSNQPVLTIGYFVDKDEFEIGSMASLMIATYYYALSKGGDGSDEFGEVISQAVWYPLASVEEYNSGSGFPTEVEDEDGNVIFITSWNEYFAYLASEAGGGHYVFLNNSATDTGWGYYYVDEDSKPVFYDKFKQVANISGVLTEQDIAILNGMFSRTTLDGEGNVVEEKSYDWGMGAQYLTNFVKSGVGNVATAMGAVFTGVFTGSYDGNGYVIDRLNIVGVAGSGNGYYGMFESIGDADNAAIVNNVHLRNVNITVNGGAGTVYVGGIAGRSYQESVNNVSVHGVITVNTKGTGTAYVGGVFGSASGAVDGAIVIGNINVKGGMAYVGGVVGSTGTSGSVSNAVSMMQIWVTGSSPMVGGIVGSGNASDSEFMLNSVWVNSAVALSGVGKTYTELYSGSISGYSTANKYYHEGETGNAKGAYDVLEDVQLTALDGDEATRTNPHESMRLADIIDIYVLLYYKIAATTVVDGNSVDVYTMSTSSPLVGSKHGTDASGDAIAIGNQQGIALMRELRFATFTLANDVYMYSTYRLTTASGAFIGKVITNGHYIYIPKQSGAIKMFEAEITPVSTTVIKVQ